MTPVLVDPPSGVVVELSDMKGYLRVDHNADDALIEALQAAAVAHLDGWTGILGRCILPQTWSIDLPAGCHTLPFPDVTGAERETDGQTVVVELEQTGSGFKVLMSKPGTVRFSCAMPAHVLPAVEVAVKLWVAEAYERREAGSAGSGAAYKALVAALRWWSA